MNKRQENVDFLKICNSIKFICINKEYKTYKISGVIKNAMKIKMQKICT